MQQPLESWEVRRLRRGAPTRLYVYEVRDDDDYSEPTRRMIVLAPSLDAAEAMWDDPETAWNAFARPVFLKGRHLRLPATESRVLHTQELEPTSAPSAPPQSEAA